MYILREADVASVRRYARSEDAVSVHIPSLSMDLEFADMSQPDSMPSVRVKRTVDFSVFVEPVSAAVGVPPDRMRCVPHPPRRELTSSPSVVDAVSRAGCGRAPSWERGTRCEPTFCCTRKLSRTRCTPCPSADVCLCTWRSCLSSPRTRSSVTCRRTVPACLSCWGATRWPCGVVAREATVLRVRVFRDPPPSTTRGGLDKVHPEYLFAGCVPARLSPHILHHDSLLPPPEHLVPFNDYILVFFRLFVPHRDSDEWCVSPRALQALLCGCVGCPLCIVHGLVVRTWVTAQAWCVCWLPVPAAVHHRA